MSLTVQKLKAKDLQTLLLEKGKSYVGAITKEQAEALELAPHAYSIFVDGKILLCGGVTEYWKNRGEAWAVFHPECKSHFVALHNASKRFLDLCPIRRIEAGVDCDFEPGHRWVKALGFKLEAARMSAFLPDGSDASLYSRRCKWL